MKTKAFNFQNEVIALKDPLRYFALSLTHDDNDADDLVQETMLKALIYKDKFAENTNLKAWLFTIMKNLFINNYRKKTKVRMIFDGSKELFQLNVPETKKAYDPDAQINYKQIQEAMDALEEDYRKPLRLYFEGYKYKEIADILELPIGTVKSRIFLARKQLVDPLKPFVHEHS
jgi:RNA polymerase sigma factor (sigma-70 family)